MIECSDYDPPLDPYGDDALSRGANCYQEAMGYSAPEDREARIDCFCAAEALYRIAALKGNPYAFLNLGYVYSYDRCEGRYPNRLDNCEGRCSGSASFGYLLEDKGKSGADRPDEPFDREGEAFRCFKHAAEAGIAEGMYKLGDMYKRGIGCEPDAASAFSWYGKAYEAGKGDDPCIWGSAALRLGEAYELGFGCKQDFERALKWYEIAATGLEIAVECGESWYTKALKGAKDSAKRMRQEIDGGY